MDEKCQQIVEECRETLQVGSTSVRGLARLEGCLLAAAQAIHTVPTTESQVVNLSPEVRAELT